MAIYKATYGLPGDQEDNPYLIAEDEEKRKKILNPLGNGELGTISRAKKWYGDVYEPREVIYRPADAEVSQEPETQADITPSGYNPFIRKDPLDIPPAPVTPPAPQNPATPTEPTNPTVPTEPTNPTTPTTGEDDEADWSKIYDELMKSGSITDKYKAAIEAAIKAQQLTTKQAVEQLEYEKEKADKARIKANREADLTFSRAINSTGKINQNIRSSGLAGSGWQETSQVGLTNAYQNALNTNSSDYNTAVKELNIAISQAKTSGDIATMQAIQTYAIQLAQQLYQEARDAVADRQWELSYALQKAAFDLEHAAQTGSNSNYYNSGSYSYPGWDYPGTETEEVINPEDSEATSEIIQSKLKDLNRYLVGSDFKERASLLISEYSGNLTDTDLESLANSCGMTTDEMDQYVMAYLR